MKRCITILAGYIFPHLGLRRHKTLPSDTEFIVRRKLLRQITARLTKELILVSQERGRSFNH